METETGEREEEEERDEGLVAGASLEQMQDGGGADGLLAAPVFGAAGD